MLNLNKPLDDFNELYNAKVSNNPFALINDEYIEMINEDEHTPEHLKELVDVIYITAQQMRAMGFDIIVNTSLPNTKEALCEWLKLIDTIQHLKRVDLEQVITRAIGYANHLGYDWQAAFNEVHRSNMSKTLPANLDMIEVAHELNEAKSRYPGATIDDRGAYSVLLCKNTKKIIKPMCYSPANIKWEWLS